MKNKARMCPVCWMVVEPTGAGAIPKHFVKATRSGAAPESFESNVFVEACPAVGYPFRITSPLRSEEMWAENVRRAEKVLAS